MNNFKKNKSKIITVGPVSIWMFLFILIPLIYILFISFMQRDMDGGILYKPTLDNYSRMFKPIYLSIFLDSIYIAFLTTILTLLFGYPFVYFASKIRKRLRLLVLILIIFPFWTNSLIRTYSWMVLLRAEGIINNVLIYFRLIKEPIKMLYTYGAVLVGMVYTLFPFMVLPLYNSIEKLDKSYLEAAKDLGARRWKTFLTITLPLTMPGVVAGSILVFITSIGLFFISDLMGGSKVMLIGNLIKNQFLQARDWPFGAALSIVMIGLSLLFIGGYIKLIGKKVDMEVF